MLDTKHRPGPGHIRYDNGDNAGRDETCNTRREKSPDVEGGEPTGEIAEPSWHGS